MLGDDVADTGNWLLYSLDGRIVVTLSEAYSAESSFPDPVKLAIDERGNPLDADLWVIRQ